MNNNTLSLAIRKCLLATFLTGVSLTSAYAQSDPFGNVAEQVGNPVWNVLSVVIIVLLFGEGIMAIVAIIQQRWGMLVGVCVAFAITGGLGLILKNVYTSLKDSPF